MLTTEATHDRDRDATRRYLVKCEGCSFERPAAGRETAVQAGTDHRRETGHEVLALEVPLSNTSS